jgi:Zn-dependent protease with chaperone function
MNFSPNDFIHPEDNAALRQLEAIPGFDAVLKAGMRVFQEQLLHGINMASKIRLGPEQLPELYARLPPICALLGVEEPEFYLEMNPAPNAYTYGDTRTFLTVTSGLLECLNEAELKAVLAHECGHIACRHVLYHTMASLLFNAGRNVLGPVMAIAKPIELALLYWQRRSELSSDRAAAVAMGGALPVVETMIRLAGGPAKFTGKVNVELYVRQAEAYDELCNGSAWDKTLQNMAIMESSHPFPSVRAREITRWCETDDFRRLMEIAEQVGKGTVCPKCGHTLSKGWRFCNHCGAKA